jgi:hypothetical protein
MVLVLLVAAFGFALIHQASAAWYSTGGTWAHRKTVTIDHTKVPTSQSNFPVLINLSSDTDLSAYAQADADDILFTSSDAITKLSHEIERYASGTGELQAWVKVPSLSSSSDTVLYMYYGNGSATSQQNAANVWDANFQDVYHLGNGTTLSGADSTGLSNGTITTPTATAGKIDGGGSFNGTTDRQILPW